MFTQLLSASWIQHHVQLVSGRRVWPWTRLVLFWCAPLKGEGTPDFNGKLYEARSRNVAIGPV